MGTTAKQGYNVIVGKPMGTIATPKVERKNVYSNDR